MIADTPAILRAHLKPYPAMKDSGVPWLGEVPEHWEVKRGKHLFRCIDIRSSTGNEELLTVSSNRGVVPRSSATVTMFKAESYVGYKLCWPGDLVINSLWAWAGGLGVSRRHGIVSSAYGVYRLRASFTDYSSYIHELVRSTLFQWELQVRSKGIWISRLQLTDIAFLEAPFPLPPLSEQAAIVRFLAYYGRKIRRYIRAKQKLIKLLEEQKQAIIHQAVTRGLDPGVRLKPSGVEWLGDVPEHWEVVRLKEITTRVEQGWSPQCDAQPVTGDEWGVLKVGCVNRDTFDESQNKKLPLTLTPVPELQIRDGDILVSRANTRELLGLASLAVNPREKLILCDKLFRFRAIEERADPRFLVHSIRQRTSRAQIESKTNGASDSMQNIGQNVVRNLWLALPPLDEQRKLVMELKEEISMLMIGIDHARRQISFLQEYHTRLISDVVTGKFDVRETAAHLPDEVEEPELPDEVDTLADAEADTETVEDLEE